MKQLLLFLAFVLTALPAFAQFGICEPDQIYADSAAGVYPLPYEPDLTPEGGITDSACLNKPYQFEFTAVINDSVTIPGFGTIPLDSLRLESVSGLPTGMEWSCNPPSCLFPKNTLGCVAVYGTATSTADLGDNELVITVTAYSFIPIENLTFPNPAFFPGSYSLYVYPEDNPDCYVYPVSTTEVPSNLESVRNIPNPFNGTTTLEVQSKTNEQYDLIVTDMLGQQVHRQRVTLTEGLNQIPFDGGQLAEGIYLYTFQNENGQLTKKMVISRQ